MAEGMTAFHTENRLNKKRRKSSGKSEAAPSSQSSMQPCPQCGSKRLYKDGFRYLMDGSTIQRWLCRDCGFRFSPMAGEPKNIKGFENQAWDGNYAELDPKKLPKVLVLPEERLKTANGLAGATNLSKMETESKIIEFLWWMHKQGYRQSTIVSRSSRLKRLVKLEANLMDPESVKQVIATQDNWKESRKEAMVYAYDLFCKWFGLKWSRPIYKASRKLPFIPLER